MPVASVGGSGAEGFQGISEAVRTLSVAATSGGFTISDDGGQRLITAITTLQHKIDQHLQKAGMLSNQPALGTTPAASTYKPFLATIASDPTQGAVTVLTKLKQDLESAATAIKNSMASYQETDQTNGRLVNNAGIGPVVTA